MKSCDKGVYNNTSLTTHTDKKAAKEDVIQIIRVMRQFHNKLEAAANKQCYKYNTTLSQIEILIYISKNDEKKVYANDIEDFFEIRNSTSSGILRRMEQKGLISREKNREDGRKKIIEITEKGNAVLQTFTEEELIQRVDERFTSEEMEVLKNIMDKIISNLEKYEEE